MLDHIKATFGQKVRVRVMGILDQNHKLLMIKHRGIGKEGVLWLPPGGGVEFGQSLEEALKQEFLEEVHLEVECQKLMFIHEYINDDLHAIEFFFQVVQTGGTARLGYDPELGENEQMLEELAYLSSEELKMLPKNHLHGAFHTGDPIKRLHGYRGIITFDY